MVLGVESDLDWLQSLKQFFINVSYHILVASLTLMAQYRSLRQNQVYPDIVVCFLLKKSHSYITDLTRLFILSPDSRILKSTPEEIEAVPPFS